MTATRALPSWRSGLPRLQGQLVVLREVQAPDVPALVEMLSPAEASRFGLEGEITADALSVFVARAQQEREAGVSYTFAVTLKTTGAPVGLVRVKHLDPGFETAEGSCTLASSARGTGIFAEATKLVEVFAFETVGTRRLEARVPLDDGRANGALRKIGATQEGVLRRASRQDGEYTDQALWSVLKEDRLDQAPADHRRDH